MEWALGGIFLFVTCIVLPWLNHCRHNDMRAEVNQLRALVIKLAEDVKLSKIITPDIESEIKEVVPEPSKPKPKPLNEGIVFEAEAQIKQKIESVEPKPKKQKLSFEQQFGARLPVWIGGIALALAGFFMVKYSIDNNLLGEDIRVILGCVSGIALLFAGDWVRQIPSFANGVRISQSLSGAGIAVLYVSIFAATSLYELIDPYLGFAGMAATTAAAVYLSLRHGAPIALLGLVGGFLTPALLGTSSASTPILFIYLYFVFTGLMFVIRKENWWWLSIPSILGAICWVIFWLFVGFNPSDTIWLGLFLIAVSATIVITSKQRYDDDQADASDAFKFGTALNYIGIGSATVLMAVVAGKAGFGMIEWGLFGLLSIGAIGLAYYDQKLYKFAPLAAMIVNAVMLLAWDHANPTDYVITLFGFAALFVGSGYYLLWKARTPILWAGLSSATAIIYYLLGYAQIGALDFIINIDHQWGIIALILAGASVYATTKVADFYSRYEYKEYLLAIFAVTATTFISLALTIELQREFLSIAFAAQVLAIALINTKVSIKALRYISMILALVFGILLIPQILLLFQLTAYSLVEAKLHLQESVPIVKWPLFQLGIPAMMFILASYLLRKQDDDRLVRYFEMAAIALIGVMGYYFTRNTMHADENVLFIKASFFERGIITNVLFVYGLACYWLGQRFDRSSFSLGGIVLSAVALFRIIYFDMLAYNPVWANQNVGDIPIINYLIVPYGLPIIWSYYASQMLGRLEHEKFSKYLNGFVLVLLFTLISMNIRQFFHGEFLDSNIATNAEIYTYSVVWLLMGVGLLFTGTYRKDVMLRYASLAIMLLTVGKVFLYDASELEGLYRVFSFLGLGASLIGLSWFYTRFVFVGEDRKAIES